MIRHMKMIEMIVILIIFTITTGCTTMGNDLTRDDTVKIEKISSKRGSIGLVSVSQKENEVTIRGEVKRRPPGRGYIPGHIDVEVLNASGTTMETIKIDYRQRSYRTRSARFYSMLGMIPLSGSTVRVVHHNVKTHSSL